MIVVVSDLHFQDVQLEPPGVRVDPNVPAEALERFFRGIARRTEDDIRAGRKITDVTFVLAGDIFELHRSERWFSSDVERGNPDNLRPWMVTGPLNVRDPKERALDAMIARVLGGIVHADGAPVPQKPPGGAGTAASLDKLTPQMQAIRDAWANPERYRFPVPVRFVYLPGNHDRLANLSPTAARAVRELLGIGGADSEARINPRSVGLRPSVALPSGGPLAPPTPPTLGSWRFPHRFVDPRHGVLIRHGHEYDASNCEFFLGRPRSVLTDDLYDRPTIGDLVTVDVAGRLPNLFRSTYKESLDPDAEDGRLYRRIREIDDLRPLGAIVDWVLYSAADGGETARAAADGGKAVWKSKLSPVLGFVVQELAKNRFLSEWMARHDKRGPDRMDVLQAALSRPSVRAIGRMTLGSAGVIRMLLRAATADRDAGKLGPNAMPDLDKLLKAELSLGEEVDPKDERFLTFLVSGHTHNPGVDAAKSVTADGREIFTIDTGTWRRLIRRCRDGKTFATTRMATYGIFYADDEGPGHRFQVWTGVTAGGQDL